MAPLGPDRLTFGHVQSAVRARYDTYGRTIAARRAARRGFAEHTHNEDHRENDGEENEELAHDANAQSLSARGGTTPATGSPRPKSRAEPARSRLEASMRSNANEERRAH
jgi:hypothetical protein